MKQWTRMILTIILGIVISITLVNAGEDEPVDLTQTHEDEVIRLNPSTSPSVDLPGPINFEEQVSLSLAGYFSLDDALDVSLPRYPEWAAEQGITSFSAIVYFTVDVEGQVNLDMTVIESSGYPNWDYMVKQALMEWRFVPDPDDQIESRAGLLKISYDLMSE